MEHLGVDWQLTRYWGATAFFLWINDILSGIFQHPDASRFWLNSPGLDVDSDFSIQHCYAVWVHQHLQVNFCTGNRHSPRPSAQCRELAFFFLSFGCLSAILATCSFSAMFARLFALVSKWRAARITLVQDRNAGSGDCMNRNQEKVRSWLKEKSGNLLAKGNARNVSSFVLCCGFELILHGLEITLCCRVNVSPPVRLIYSTGSFKGANSKNKVQDINLQLNETKELFS